MKNPLQFPSRIFSVVILTHNRPDFLRLCLESLLVADLHSVEEIIIAINGEDPEGARVAQLFQARIPSLKIIQINRQSRGAARNTALAHARGQWIYFLDDDVEAPTDVFVQAADLIRQHPEAWLVGGPNLTPPDSGFFERLSGQVLESWVGAGPMRRRYFPGPHAGCSTDISFALCNLCVKAAAFKDLGLRFDPALASAEENLFITQLIELGYKAFYAPTLAVYHHRRGSLMKFLAQVHDSGVGRRQILQKSTKAARAIFFLPAILLFYVVFLAIVRPPIFFWAPLGLYALAMLIDGVRCGLKCKSFWVALFFPLLVPLCHLSYGVGLIAGRHFLKSYRMA